MHSGPEPSPSPPADDSPLVELSVSSENTDGSAASSSATSPSINLKEHKATAKVTTATRVGHDIISRMLRRSIDGAVATAVEHFKGIDAPHNTAQAHGLRRIARLLDMHRWTGVTCRR